MMTPTQNSIGFGQFLWRSTASHLLTYFAAGLAFSTALDYKTLYGGEVLMHYMKPVSSEWVAAGPLLNLLRGLLFGLTLWPLRDSFLFTAKGWLRLWILFVGLAILGTCGPAPGSIEGMIYTQLPPRYHWLALPEILVQTLLYSVLLFIWCKKPGKIWNITMLIAVILIALMSLAGIFLRPVQA